MIFYKFTLPYLIYFHKPHRLQISNSKKFCYTAEYLRAGESFTLIPHAALVFASNFSAALRKSIQPVMYIILPTIAFFIYLFWYAVVACLLSTDRPRQAYIKYRKSLDKLSGGVMALLGIRLLLK